MVFEVDNTTEQLIQELQKSIQKTIDDIERGQIEIKELIDEVNLSCSDLATANQAEAMSNDITATMSAIKKLATTQQLTQAQATGGKILEGMEQASQAMVKVHSEMSGVKSNTSRQAEAIAKMQSAISAVKNDVVQQSKAIIDAQGQSTDRLEKHISELSASDAKARVAQLQEIADKLHALSDGLHANMDKLFSEAEATLVIAESNRATLSAIVHYLSLPGYKRLFKGMEVPKDEAPK